MPIVLSLFSLSPCLLFAQKIEVEKRISPEEAPALIHQFLEREYSEKSKVKFYEEQNESGRFFEAKFCFQKARYSVKFNPEGQLVDTERQIRYKEIPAEAAGQIEKQLKGQFQRHKVVRTQEVLENGQAVGYELEIKGKREVELGYFEGQFDSEGRQQSLRTIEQPPNDFLFF
ncbi:MAG: hypothetical protein H6573_27355 [Lewinellaceae bacterium]|nr:hypothetical protein [Phaeodactylibacter sp.]MCB9351184.1 hypothetical protein [Lewinellaceae bacterium]